MLRDKYELKVKLLIKTEKKCIHLHLVGISDSKEESPSDPSKRLPRRELRVSEQSSVPDPGLDSLLGLVFILLLRIDTLHDFVW